MITEDELQNKYPVGTPWWRKDAIERFICNQHGESTILVRDNDLYLHANTTTELIDEGVCR